MSKAKNRVAKEFAQANGCKVGCGLSVEAIEVIRANNAKSIEQAKAKLEESKKKFQENLKKLWNK